MLNEIRKDFTLSERDSIRRAIEAEEKAKAKERQTATLKKGTKKPPVPQNSWERGSSPTTSGSNGQSRHAKESKSIAAKRVGLGSHDMTTQRAMVAARARELYDQQAKERQRARKGYQPGASKENLPDLSQARDAAGKAVGVSGKTVDYASRVIGR